MNFQGIGAQGNYAAAGKSVADDTVRTFAATRRNSPNFGKMVQDAANIRSKEKVAMNEITSEVVSRGIKAKADVKNSETTIDARKGYDKSRRKAGVLAASGKFFSGATQYMGNKRTKREVGANDAWYDKQAKKTVDNAERWAKAMEGSNYEAPDLDTAPAGGNQTNSNSGGTVDKNVSAQHSSNAKGALSKDAIRQHAIDAGFTPDQANVVVGIAGGESGFDPTNSTERSGLKAATGEDSVGLMQINWGYHKDSGWLQKLGITKREDLFDPALNMKAAKFLHDGRGDFGDWTVFNKGIYKDYL